MAKNGCFAGGLIELGDETEQAPVVVTIDSRDGCLEQLLAAFHDIAEYDDIHQAAQRLKIIQDWIGREALAAAADPIFRDEPLETHHRQRATA